MVARIEEMIELFFRLSHQIGSSSSIMVVHCYFYSKAVASVKGSVHSNEATTTFNSSPVVKRLEALSLSLKVIRSNPARSS